MTKAKRSSLGVAMIARDAEDTIGQCLDSFRKHVQQIVVGVDELTKDRTAAVAKKHGADLVVPIKVSDWHECADHGRILAQHFGDARNQSFTHLDKSLDFWMWLDSDDVLQGVEHIPGTLEQLKQENALGAWLPYDYGNVQGRVSTLFHRERILRADVAWKWRFRVHETVEPTNPDERGWQIRDDIRLYHQDHERSEPAAARNLRLLEIDLEEDPNNSRTLFYLGNQYFALQDNQAAAFWYERLLELGQNPYEKWQSAVYLSMSYQRMGALDAAAQASYRAIDIMPQHPEPYYQLAVIARYRGDAERCLYWTKEARNGKTPPPFFVFKNPLDYSFNNRVVLADALEMLGRVPEARAELEQAASVLPDNMVVDNIAKYRKLENCAALAQAYATLATPLPDDAKIALWEALDFPTDVRQFGRARDLVMPAYLRQRPNTQPRIVFWCGRAMEEWAPPSLNRTGIGGSETAVVEIARRFSADGWRVDVFNGAGRYEGVYDEVGYWEPERFVDEPTDVTVSWRQPHLTRSYGKNLLWCHDLNYGPQSQETMRAFDKVLGVSQWHADYLSRVYGIETDYVPNGIDLSRFTLGQRRQPMQVVYTSSPDRGLESLLRIWPRILNKEPGARLVVAYGFENIDKMIATGQQPHLAQWRGLIQQLIDETPNVEFRGRLPQSEVAQLFCESYAWAYPTHFLEVSCITAMEAMAGGCVPVTTCMGALPETIGGFGVSIPGMPHSNAFGDFFTQCLLAVLMQPEVRMPLSLNGPKRAAELTWDRAFERWRSIVEGLLSPRKAEQEKELVLA